jgi:hypothetical protein
MDDVQNLVDEGVDASGYTPGTRGQGGIQWWDGIDRRGVKRRLVRL